MRGRSTLLAACLILSGATVLTTPAESIARGRNRTLPAAVEKAVREAFPDATIRLTPSRS